MAIETLRPTDAFNPGGWANPAQGYDANTGAAATKVNVASTPDISFGGAAAGEATNAWATKGNSWDSAVIYATFEKGAGTDDTVELLVTDNGGVTRHILVASTSGAVGKQEFSATLNSADWGGAGFPNAANIRVRVNGAKSKGADGVTVSVYDIRIDGTYTATSTFTYSASGGLTSGGAATTGSILNHPYVASGGLTSSGAATAFPILSHVYSASGGLDSGGAASTSYTSTGTIFTYSASGGLTTGGIASTSVEHDYPYAASGGVTAGGVATIAIVKNYTASGGINSGGAASANPIYIHPYSASGGIVSGGSATAFPLLNHVYSSSGGVNSGGSGNATKTKNYLASGGLTSGGAAATIYFPSGAVFTYTANGGLASGGAANTKKTSLYSYQSLGGVVASGSAGLAKTKVYKASGGLVSGGQALSNLAAPGQIVLLTAIGKYTVTARRRSYHLTSSVRIYELDATARNYKI